MSIKIYSDSQTYAVIANEENRTYQLTTLDTARDVAKRNNCQVYFKEQSEHIINQLAIDLGYERMR